MRRNSFSFREVILDSWLDIVSIHVEIRLKQIGDHSGSSFGELGESSIKRTFSYSLFVSFFRYVACSVLFKSGDTVAIHNFSVESTAEVAVAFLAIRLCRTPAMDFFMPSRSLATRHAFS